MLCFHSFLHYFDTAGEPIALTPQRLRRFARLLE